MLRSSHSVLALAALLSISLLVACGGEPSDPPPTMGGDALIARWAGVTQVDDLVFAPGRDVTLHELFELRADGSMRGDFAGEDETSGCVIWYSLSGSYAVEAEALDAAWSSIRARTLGCSDPSLDHPARDVDAGERAIWDAELDGLWTVDGNSLTLETAAGALAYRRVSTPFIARWHGTTQVDDLTFAEGRNVTLEEDFWLNVDGSMTGFFRGSDPVSGCSVDYRLRGTWVEGAGSINVEWSSIRGEVFGCDDPDLDEPREEASAEEYALWDSELDGSWVASDTTLTITGVGELVYSRGL